jgi:type IV pilus assembly protein PilW
MKTANNPNYSGSINRFQPPVYNPKAQGGFSLIEVMISSLVGLVLLAGTMQMFSSTQQSSHTNTAITRMQENGRAGLYFLENSIRLSGYRADSLKDFKDVFTDSSPFFDFDGQVIKGVDNDAVNGNNILNGSDSILMRYGGNGDGFIYDCIGSPVAGAQVTESKFLVNDQGELICTPDLTNNPNTRETLIDGVEDMQIFYGIDTDSDFTTNYYVSANDIPNGSEVVSVRIFLLFQSDPKMATQAQAYRWFDENNEPKRFDGNEKDKFTDKKDERRLRKVFSSTIAVRNLVD